MTIEEIRKHKQKLEKEIGEAIEKFHKRVPLAVKAIRLSTSHCYNDSGWKAHYINDIDVVLEEV